MIPTRQKLIGTDLDQQWALSAPHASPTLAGRLDDLFKQRHMCERNWQLSQCLLHNKRGVRYFVRFSRILVTLMPLWNVIFKIKLKKIFQAVGICFEVSLPLIIWSFVKQTAILLHKQGKAVESTMEWKMDIGGYETPRVNTSHLQLQPEAEKWSKCSTSPTLMWTLFVQCT